MTIPFESERFCKFYSTCPM